MKVLKNLEILHFMAVSKFENTPTQDMLSI